MKVSRVSEMTYNLPDVSQVRDNLERLAEQHRVSVDELVKSAEAAGPNGPAYLVRALNLQKRIDRLEKLEQSNE